MYCSQCGKKVKENMLFCPFCGSPIVIPEQDDVVQPIPAAQKATASTAINQTESAIKTLEEVPESSIEEFVPLNIEQELHNPKTSAQKERPAKEHIEDVPSDQPVRLKGHKPDLSAAASKGAPNIPSRKAANTHVPPLHFNPDDMFLDGADEEEEEDDFEYEYEEPEHGSFFVRHIRGFVTLILFAIVALVILGWAISGSGQLALTRADLAWKPGVYAELAYESYQNGGYIAAGDYYVKALSRDETNYDYANSASVSYYMANDNTRAESMAHNAISINPNRSEAYELLLRLYPSASERPEKIKALILTGYQLTGNESLNIQ